MSQEKYIGMDVHQASISVAVMDARGKLIMECLLETKAATILEFIQGLRGTLALTFEEGTSAAWLHDLLKPHVSRLVVCDPRKNALLKDGNKSDRVDARKLAELLRTNQVKPVYHGKHRTRALKELGRSYLTITKDVTRVMNRIKAVYRSWAIPCAGTSVYAPRHRAEWLEKLVEPGVRIRAEHLYQQLDSLEPVRLEARRELLLESRKHAAVKLLRQIPSIGPIRAALLVALLQTPHRFCTKRQLWAYSGFAVEIHESGEYRWVQAKLQRRPSISNGDLAVRAVLPLYPRGPRSGPGYSVPVHPHLIDPIRPTRRHNSTSPLRGLYEMSSLCISAWAPMPRQPTSGSVLSLAFRVDMLSSGIPGSSSAACTQFLHQ